MSFDKQIIRDYLEATDWDKTEPGPQLPFNVIAQTMAKYVEAWKRLADLIDPIEILNNKTS